VHGERRPVQGLEQPGLDARVEQCLPGGHDGDGPGDLGGPGVLGEVAARAGTQRREHGLVIGMGGQHDDGDVRHAGP
jgi:hypothetical protein